MCSVTLKVSWIFVFREYIYILFSFGLMEVAERIAGTIFKFTRHQCQALSSFLAHARTYHFRAALTGSLTHARARGNGTDMVTV